MFLTTSQKRALLLLNNAAALYTPRSIKSQFRTVNGWESSYYEFGEYRWSVCGLKPTYKPSSIVEGCNDSFWPAPKQIAWAVAGELQNKALAEVHIDIRNRFLTLRLTPLGQLEAGKLEVT